MIRDLLIAVVSAAGITSVAAALAGLATYWRACRDHGRSL